MSEGIESVAEEYVRSDDEVESFEDIERLTLRLGDMVPGNFMFGKQRRLDG